MHRPVREQVVVVTGASSGIGRAIARAFGAQGARVALLARGKEGLDACAREIEQAGGQAMVLPLDVSDVAAVNKAAHEIVERWGRIDTWVNNAMVTVLSPVVEMRPDEFRRVTEVNYLGAVYGTLAALRYMLPADSGVIIQIGSALVYRSIPLQSAYCASKAAMRGFTDSLRSELIHDQSKVQLCMLQLPAVNTPQFDVARSRMPMHPMPVPPIYQPEVIAEAALHASEHPAREIWIAGSAIKAIVGQKVIPGMLDRYLGHIGYAAQQSDEPVEADRPDNLHAPLAGDRGAHGRFDAQARPRSLELMARLNRGKIGAALGVAAALALIAMKAVRA